MMKRRRHQNGVGGAVQRNEGRKLEGLRLFEIMIQKGIDTPAIFVTGSASPEVEARSLELGAADFLRKPIRKEALLPRIRAILQRRQRARENL